MYHLAQRCPHCGASAVTTGPALAPAPVSSAKPALSLTPEEARALLAVQSRESEPRQQTLLDVAVELVEWRADGLDRVLSVVAGPVTVLTAVTLSAVMLRVRRSRRDVTLAGASAFGVPAVTGLLFSYLLQQDVDSRLLVGLGVSAFAWLARALRRSRAQADPLR